MNDTVMTPVSTETPASIDTPLEHLITNPSPALESPQGLELWYSGIKDNDAMNWIKDRGLRDIDALAKSAYGLSKLLGHDRAGRTFVLPTETSSPEEIASFREKLGVPSVPEAYDFGVQENAPEVDKSFASKMQQTFLEAGVPKAAGDAIAKAYNEYVQTLGLQSEESLIESRNSVVSRWKKSQGINAELSEQAIAYGARELMPGKTGGERDVMIDHMIDLFGESALNILKRVGSMSEDNQIVVNNGVASTVRSLENQRRSLLDPSRGKDLHSAETINALMELARKGLNK